MTGTFVQVAFTRKNTLIVCLVNVTFEHHLSACTSYVHATSLTLGLRMTLCHYSCTTLSCRVSVLEKEDLKHIVDIVTNAKLVVSSIQDVARKLGDYVSTSTNSGEFY